MSRIRPPAGREESARSATHLTLVSDLSARSSGPAGKHARVAMPLKDDVLKFASEIGLAASGGGASGGGFDDRDFRPPTTKASSGKQPREGERAKGGKRKRDALIHGHAEDRGGLRSGNSNRHRANRPTRG